MDLTMSQDSSSSMNMEEDVPDILHDSSLRAGEESTQVGPLGMEVGEMKNMPGEHSAFLWPHETLGVRQEQEADMNPEAEKDQGTSQANSEGENGLVKEPELHPSSTGLASFNFLKLWLAQLGARARGMARNHEGEYRLKAGMSPAGRKRDPVWVLFERIQWGQYHRAKCKSCHKEVQGIPLRMKRHLEICTMSPSASEKDPRKKFLHQHMGTSGNAAEVNPEAFLESSMSVVDRGTEKEPEGRKVGAKKTLDKRSSSPSHSMKDEMNFKDKALGERATKSSRDHLPTQANSEEGGSNGNEQELKSSSNESDNREENGSVRGPEQHSTTVANGPVPRRNLGMAPGRKKDPIWFSFERTKKGKGHRARCKNCNKEIQGIVHRMKRHLQLCTMSLSPLGKVLGSPVLTVGTSTSTWFMAASSAPIGNRSSSQSDGEKAPWEEAGEATMLVDRDIVCTCGRNFNDCGTGHPRCRGHSDCFQEGRYLARACDVCRYIWFLADNEGPLQSSAVNALRLWKRGFQKNTRYRNKNVDIFVDPHERKEFERIVAPYPHHIKVTDPALLALMKGTSSSSGPGSSKWSSTSTPPVDAPVSSTSQNEHQPTSEPAAKEDNRPRSGASKTQQRLGSLEEGMNNVQETLRSLMEALSDKHDPNNDSRSDNDSHLDNDSHPDNDSNPDNDSHCDEDSSPDNDSHPDDDFHPNNDSRSGNNSRSNNNSRLDVDLHRHVTSPSSLQPDVTSQPNVHPGMTSPSAPQAHKGTSELHSPLNEMCTSSDDYDDRTQYNHPMPDLPLEPETIIQEVYGDESFEDDRYRWHPAAGKIRLTPDGTVIFPSGNIATKDQVEIQYEGGEVWYRWKPTSEEPQFPNFPTYMGKARHESRAAFKEYCERLFTPRPVVEQPEQDPSPPPPPPPPPPPKNPADFSPLSFTAACLKDATANFATVIRSGKYVHEEASLFANVVIHGSNTSSFIQEAKEIFHGKNLDPEVTSQKLQLQVTLVDSNILDAEFQSRKQLWNSISSLAMMEGTNKAAPDPKSVATYNTLAKTALPNLCSDITAFFLAKFEVRKEYLVPFDNRNPHYFALLYSSPWCPDLFPEEVMGNLVKQAEVHCKPVSRMLGKASNKPVKKRSAGQQPSMAPDHKWRVSEMASKEHSLYPYKPGKDYRPQNELAQSSKQTTEYPEDQPSYRGSDAEYPQDQPSYRGDEQLALFERQQFNAPTAGQESSGINSLLSENIGTGTNGPIFTPSKE